MSAQGSGSCVTYLRRVRSWASLLRELRHLFGFRPGRGDVPRSPSMGQAVNTYSTHALTSGGVTASVRSFRRPESLGGARWVVLGRRFSACRPGDFPASAFSAGGREPSFYLGLCGPLLRSVHQGGIAYAGGLRPNGLAHRSCGCSPLYRSRLRIPWALDVPAALRTPFAGPGPR
jgi:hypothetical protein